MLPHWPGSALPQDLLSKSLFVPHLLIPTFRARWVPREWQNKPYNYNNSNNNTSHCALIMFHYHNMLSTWYLFFFLIFTPALCSPCYNYTHFADKETEAQGGQIIQPIRGWHWDLATVASTMKTHTLVRTLHQPPSCLPSSVCLVLGSPPSLCKLTYANVWMTAKLNSS